MACLLSRTKRDWGGGGGEREREESPYCLWPVVAPGSWILGIRGKEACDYRLKAV